MKSYRETLFIDDSAKTTSKNRQPEKNKKEHGKKGSLFDNKCCENNVAHRMIKPNTPKTSRKVIQNQA